MQKHRLCSRGRALKVVVGLAAFCLLLGCVQIKLIVNSCPGQYDAPDTFDKVWSIATEALIVLFAPLAVLALNVLLIRKLHRTAQLSASLGRHNTAESQQPNPATDVMLLSISFYFVFISLPLSAVFVMSYFIPEDSYPTAKFVIDNTCASLYASNFVIYLFTGRTFRRELLVLCGRYRTLSNANSRTTDVVSA